MARILFAIAEGTSVVTHRLHLVEEAVANGHQVGIATNVSDVRATLEATGAQVFDWPVNRGTLNPFSALRTFTALGKIFFGFKPQIVHAVALKPAILAGLLCHFFSNIALVAALGGVGYIFSSSRLKATLLRLPVIIFLRLSLYGQKKIMILQNPDDRDLFVNLRAVGSDKVVIIKGAGVEIHKFYQTEIQSGKKRVVFPARLLSDKGIYEFIRLAEYIQSHRNDVEFLAVGEIDPHNPMSLTQAQVDELEGRQIVKFAGRIESREMPEIYRSATVVCLPSYREGLPKALLEAASCGRPIVAFDVPGCREIVIDAYNGILVPFKDEGELRAALVHLIDNPRLCREYGSAGRSLIENEFSHTVINRQTQQLWSTFI